MTKARRNCERLEETMLSERCSLPKKERLHSEMVDSLAALLERFKYSMHFMQIPQIPGNIIQL